MRLSNYLIPCISVALFTATSCGGETTPSEQETTAAPAGHTISGKITGAEGQKVKLLVFEDSKEKFIDSTVIMNDAFELQTNTLQLREYVLFIGEELPIILFLDEENPKIEITGSAPGVGENYTITGSKASQGVHDYMTFLTQHLDVENDLMSKVQNTNPEDRKQIQKYMFSLDSISFIQRDYAINEILKDSTSPVSWMLLRELIPASGIAKMDSTDLRYFQMVANGMRSKYPYTEYVAYIDNDIASISAQIAKLNAPPVPAQEINMPNPDGKNIALSSLKGKVVLLDFWASWCGPCRKANPEVVKLYEKYKSKGFTVYSVSLDENKDKWVEAIKTDNLSWPNHVSDLKGWGSEAAALYGVGSIPATFLLDKKGNIVANNLHGAELEQKLLELLD